MVIVLRANLIMGNLNSFFKVYVLKIFLKTDKLKCHLVVLDRCKEGRVSFFPSLGGDTEPSFFLSAPISGTE